MKSDISERRRTSAAFVTKCFFTLRTSPSIKLFIQGRRSTSVCFVARPSELLETKENMRDCPLEKKITNANIVTKVLWFLLNLPSTQRFILVKRHTVVCFVK